MAVAQAAGKKVHSGIKKFLGKAPASGSWQRQGEWAHVLAKDALGRSCFGLLEDGLSAGPVAAEHGRGGGASSFCGEDGEVVEGHLWGVPP